MFSADDASLPSCHLLLDGTTHRLHAVRPPQKGLPMTRCLIVGNQTLGSDALIKVIEEKLRQGIREFYVVAPKTQAEHEAAEWTGGYFEGARTTFLVGESRAFREQMEAMRDAARWRAQDRLNLLLRLIRDVGAKADGELGDPDPVAAVKTVLETQPPFDEIIISTLPGGLSRWFDMDLPERIRTITTAKITTIHAPFDDATA